MLLLLRGGDDEDLLLLLLVVGLVPGVLLSQVGLLLIRVLPLGVALSLRVVTTSLHFVLRVNHLHLSELTLIEGGHEVRRSDLDDLVLVENLLDLLDAAAYVVRILVEIGFLDVHDRAGKLMVALVENLGVLMRNLLLLLAEQFLRLHLLLDSV